MSASMLFRWPPVGQQAECVGLFAFSCSKGSFPLTDRAMQPRLPVVADVRGKMGGCALSSASILDNKAF